MVKIIVIILMIVFNMFVSLMALAVDKTLGELKKELLGKEVIVAGHECPGTLGEEILINWFLAEEDNQKSYKMASKPDTLFKNRRLLVHAPYKLKGYRGTAIDIIPRENPPSSSWTLSTLCIPYLEEDSYFLPKRKQKTKTDIFGDPITDNSLILLR